MTAPAEDAKLANDHLRATVRLLGTALICPFLNEWEVEKLLALIGAINARRLKDYGSQETEVPRGVNSPTNRTMRN